MREAIVVEELGKRFKHYRYQVEKPYTFMEAALKGWRSPRANEYFWALRGVSFSVAPGQMVGVLGLNGAGKTTLLRLVCGIGRPDEGHTRVHGRIGALIGLGSTFSPDLTGRENVYLSGVIAGLTRREVAARFEAIVAFAEMETFIDDPVRIYSSGMLMRLAFAVIVYSEPEVLLVDEIISVGDFSFKQKCLDWITAFKQRGGAIVMVSQSPGAFNTFADEVIWINEGHMAARGEPATVGKQYLAGK